MLQDQQVKMRRFKYFSANWWITQTNPQAWHAVCNRSFT